MLIPYNTICQKYNIKPTGVLHIGGHWAEEAHDYYSNGVQRTIWVEANPSCISKLIANLGEYPDHLVFNSCITDKDDDEVVLNISNNEGQSSSILELDYHKIAHPEVEYISKIPIRTNRIDTMFKKYDLNIEDYSFVNIDIQGSELLALKSIGNLLHKVKVLYLEINEKTLYKDCPLLEDIIDYITPFGFELKEKVMAGDFYWGDAVFINKNI